jgi:hypothetical protein
METGQGGAWGDAGAGAPTPEERVAWLAEMCRLSPLAIDLFALVAAIDGEPNAPVRWWTVSSLATRVGVGDALVIAQLVPGAPLIDWGLVRTTPAPTSQRPGEARVAVNERIARFLWARRIRPAEFRHQP